MEKTNPMSKHKPPSRIRYEQNNPVLSVRMPKDFHEALKKHQQETGRSVRTILALALNKITANYSQVKTKAIREGYTKGFSYGQKIGYDAGYTKGLNEGYTQGRKNFEITYPCIDCNESMSITPNSECHKWIVQQMRLRGWIHTECPKRNQPSS